MSERLLSLVLIASVACASIGCDGRRGDKDADAGPTAPREVPVETVAVAKGDLRESIVSTSTVDSRNAVDVMAEIPGTIVELAVEQGDEVQKGQLLGRVSREELSLGVESARAAVARLEAEVQRLRPLYEQGILPRQQYDEAVYRLEEARAEQRRANISASDRRVTAPAAGIVAIRYVNPGQQVATGTPLFRVVQPDDLIVTVNLPETALGKVFEKQPAFLNSDALEGREFAGVVEKVSPVVDPRTGTVRVTIDVVEPAPDEPVILRPGMFVRTFIVTAEKKGVLTVPRRSVSSTESEDFVFVAVDGIARRREVRLGVSEGTRVEVLEGLSEGDQVIVLGKDGLKDGTAVSAELREAEPLRDGS